MTGESHTKIFYLQINATDACTVTNIWIPLDGYFPHLPSCVGVKMTQNQQPCTHCLLTFERKRTAVSLKTLNTCIYSHICDTIWHILHVLPATMMMLLFLCSQCWGHLFLWESHQPFWEIMSHHKMSKRTVVCAWPYRISTFALLNLITWSSENELMCRTLVSLFVTMVWEKGIVLSIRKPHDLSHHGKHHNRVGNNHIFITDNGDQCDLNGARCHVDHNSLVLYIL